MANRKPLTNDEGDVRELTGVDFAQAVPFSELPASLRETLTSRKPGRGPQKAPKKEMIAIRLSPDVVRGLRATGSGWQRRADDALRAWLNQPKKKRTA